jgi:putative ABC transport system ATP-binding protein
MSDIHNFGPPVVEAVDVHHHYGEGPQRADVLFDINMQVREGELVIVTGPSGSGKTTLLTILGTMRRPSEGKLRLLGTDIVNLNGNTLDVLRNRVRFLFQKRNLLSSLTALQNVMAGVSTTPLSDPAWDEPRARHLLGLLGLGDKADAWPDELSGGQQQRVALAMRAKCAVVLSTHDERIFDVASRRLHIEDGRCFEVPIHYH